MMIGTEIIFIHTQCFLLLSTFYKYIERNVLPQTNYIPTRVISVQLAGQFFQNIAAALLSLTKLGICHHLDYHT